MHIDDLQIERKNMSIIVVPVLAKAEPFRTQADGTKVYPYGQMFTNTGTAIPFGGGVFLTAAHIFDEYTNDTYDTRFQASPSSTTIFDNVKATGIFNIRPWNAAITHGGYSAITSVNDLEL